jgi:hypothetical protein
MLPGVGGVVSRTAMAQCPKPFPLHSPPILLPFIYAGGGGLGFSPLAADTGAEARCALYMGALGFECSHGRQGCRGEDAWFPSAGASAARGGAMGETEGAVRGGAIP